MNTPAWINIAQTLGLLTGDFAPFRVFDRIKDTTDGATLAEWHSWFVNEHGQLQKFSGEPENVGDWLILGVDRIEGVARLTDREEIEYRKRLKPLSLNILRKQRGLWQDLHDRLPQRIAGLKIVLAYPPLAIIDAEIQEKMADSIGERKKERARPPRSKLKLWEGNKSEFCQHIADEYKKHPKRYKSKRDAAQKIFKQFRFSKRWTWKKCYELLKKTPWGKTGEEMGNAQGTKGEL